MNVLVGNSYLTTPFRTVRGENNFTAYDLFVVTTRLTAQLGSKQLFQWEYVSTRSPSVLAGVSDKESLPQETGDSVPAEEGVVEDNGELYFAVEEQPSIEDLYIVFTDSKGAPQALPPKAVETTQKIVNGVLTNNPLHCAFLLSAPDNISRGWWRQQLSYASFPNKYSPFWHPEIETWFLDLSSEVDYSDVYQGLITDLNDQFIKRWKKKERA